MSKYSLNMNTLNNQDPRKKLLHPYNDNNHHHYHHPSDDHGGDGGVELDLGLVGWGE